MEKEITVWLFALTILSSDWLACGPLSGQTQKTLDTGHGELRYDYD